MLFLTSFVVFDFLFNVSSTLAVWLLVLLVEFFSYTVEFLTSCAFWVMLCDLDLD